MKKLNGILPIATTSRNGLFSSDLPTHFLQKQRTLVPVMHDTWRPKRSHRISAVSSEINVEGGQGK